MSFEDIPHIYRHRLKEINAAQLLMGEGHSKSDVTLMLAQLHPESERFYAFFEYAEALEHLEQVPEWGDLGWRERLKKIFYKERLSWVASQKLSRAPFPLTHCSD
jgi:hypothetical protein